MLRPEDLSPLLIHAQGVIAKALADTRPTSHNTALGVYCVIINRIMTGQDTTTQGIHNAFADSKDTIKRMLRLFMTEGLLTYELTPSPNNQQMRVYMVPRPLLAKLTAKKKAS